jgi:hypothetical protein
MVLDGTTAKSIEVRLIGAYQSGCSSAFVELTSFYIKPTFMKTNQLNAIKPYCFLTEVAQSHSLQNLLNNIICSPS